MKPVKPLGIKSYGSIPHLPGSRLGPGDHHCGAGQARIATEKKRDKHDVIIVQEKLDGGNVGVAKHQGKIIALSRAGYLASDSPYKTHHAFAAYVERNQQRFADLLNEGERICGEWLLTAVGTIYKLDHEPFVPFDIILKERLTVSEFWQRIRNFDFTPARMLASDCYSIENALKSISVSGHGAIEPVEGAIWRVERKGKVDFLTKYVRPDKVDGKYLKETIINEMPREFDYLKDYVL